MTWTRVVAAVHLRPVWGLVKWHKGDGGVKYDFQEDDMNNCVDQSDL